MDQILYSIGLSFESNSVKPIKRRLIRNPYITIAYLTSFLMARLLSLFTNDSQTLLILGDVAYIINMRYSTSINVIICCSMAIMFQLIYYYNHKKGIKQTFIVVIQAICGSISVNSIGIENEVEIMKLKKLALNIFYLLKLQNNYIIPITFASCVSFLYVIETNLTMIITFGLFHTWYWSYYLHIFINLVTYQYLYFFILCKYFRIKIKNLNAQAITLRTRFYSSNGIKNILYSYDLLYREINEYNTSYWSKFIIIFWFGFGASAVICVYMVIYRELYLPIFIMTLYLSILFSLTFLSLILIAASVNSSAKKSYKLINSLFVHISGRKYRKINNHRFKLNIIKVGLINLNYPIPIF